MLLKDVWNQVWGLGYELVSGVSVLFSFPFGAGMKVL